jgi:hypothetical protein
MWPRWPVRLPKGAGGLASYDSTTVTACGGLAKTDYWQHYFRQVPLPGGTKYFNAWYVPTCKSTYETDNQITLS